MQSIRHQLVLALSSVLVLASAVVHGSGFTPAENLTPGQTSSPTLDTSYNQEAWLVYTYDINTEGVVVNAKIHSSNGVAAVEEKVLSHVNAMRFKPAMRNDHPVAMSSGANIFTWILDIPREMSAEFDEIYQRAWDYFKQEDYDQAFELAARLKTLPGHNAFEETKFQILAASLASRWDDSTAELSHLKRIVEFQSLADRNLFSNPYVEDKLYLSILKRIQTLQLGMMMLADAKVTLDKMMKRDSNSEDTQQAKVAYQEAEGRFSAIPDVVIAGELTPVYRDGQGLWKNRLFRDSVLLADVKGNIQSVYLSCETGGDKRLRYPSREAWLIPAGWNVCTLEVAGKSGTRFTVHQLDSSSVAPR